jgi:hypothetical protein
VQDSPKITPPPPSDDRSKPLDTTWVYVGAGLTAVAGGLTLWSGLETRAAYEDLKRDMPSLEPADAQRRVEDGEQLQTRTNILLAVTGVLALSTAGIAWFGVDWSATGQPKTSRLKATPPADWTVHVNACSVEVLGHF